MLHLFFFFQFDDTQPVSPVSNYTDFTPQSSSSVSLVTPFSVIPSRIESFTHTGDTSVTPVTPSPVGPLPVTNYTHQGVTPNTPVTPLVSLLPVTPSQPQPSAQPGVSDSTEGYSATWEEELFQSDELVFAPLTLRGLLSQTAVGLSLLKKKTLTERDQGKLCDIIVQHVLPKENISAAISGETWVKWAEEIVKIFPEESADVYYKRHGEKPASGKLLCRLISVRKGERGSTEKKRGGSDTSSPQRFTQRPKAKRPKPSSCSGLCDDEPGTSTVPDEVKTALQWLSVAASPWDAVLTRWDLTHTYRIERVRSDSSETTEEYFSKYPALQQPNGYELVSFIHIGIVEPFLCPSSTYSNKD